MSNTTLEEALARAREIAMRLGAPAGSSDLGKRKFDDFSAPGLGSVKKKKVYIPVKQNPDINFLGLLIGPKGSTQKQLQERTGAKILIRGRGSQKEGQAPSPDDDDDLHVSIEGTDDAIEAAAREIEQILYNPHEAMRLKDEQLRSLGSLGSGSSMNSGEYQEELKVPNLMVGLIIGRGGDNIQKLQFQTGAHIQIAKESDMKPGETHRSIYLKGNPKAVEELRKRVEEIISSRSTGGSSQSKGSSTTLSTPIVMKVPIPNERIGYVIGKGGMNVRGIQERTRTTILIPPGPDDEDPNTRTISIGADTKAAADAAHAEIFTTLQQYQQNNSMSMSNSMLICVPDDKVGLIIGKAGATIKDMQARHRVRIQIPSQADPGSNPPVRTCTVSGAPENHHAVRYEIEMILQGQGQSLQPSYGYMAQPAQMAVPATNQWSQSQAYGQSYDPNMYANPYASSAAYYNQSAAPQPSAATTAASATTDQSAAVPTDPTAYYKDFWAYVSYYGEPAARAFYGAWSPPEGTPNPNVQSSSESAATSGNPPASAEGSSDQAKGSQVAAENTSSESKDAGGGDAWEAYKKQYGEWYEAHGKHIGADPNPPM